MTFSVPVTLLLFFSTTTATPEIYTLSLHDALPISGFRGGDGVHGRGRLHRAGPAHEPAMESAAARATGGSAYRSEERRVGKECRCRRGTDRKKRKYRSAERSTAYDKYARCVVRTDV